MDFLDKITSITKNAVDKTGDMIEINGIKTKIASEEAKITTLKGKLGEYYWKRFDAGAELEEEAAKFCTDIKNSLAVVEGYNIEIEKIKAEQAKTPNGMTVCPACGAPVAEGVKFCSECGAKIE